MNPNIVIVGAGVSGLIAAYELEKHGYAPLILESTDEIGGRVKTTIRDGAIMDHGFQVLLTAYPEAKHYLDYEALDLQKFKPGALVYMNGIFGKLIDPIRNKGAIFDALFSAVGTFQDRWRIYLLQKQLKGKTPEEIFAEPDLSTLEYLNNLGFSSKIIEQFFRPFFAGIFLEKKLATSARLFNFVFKMFAEGYAAIPAKGMAEIPKQLAGKLNNTKIEYNAKVTEIFQDKLVAGGHDYNFDRLILTISPGNVMSSMAQGQFHSVACLYFSCTRRLKGESIIVLSGSETRLVNNLHFVDDILPMNTPEHLLSVTVVEPDASAADLAGQVQVELENRYGLKGLKFIQGFDVHHALPVVESMTYTVDPSATMINEHIFMAGDQLLYPSLNAAMCAGRLAAKGVIQSLT